MALFPTPKITRHTMRKGENENVIHQIYIENNNKFIERKDRHTEMEERRNQKQIYFIFNLAFILYIAQRSSFSIHYYIYIYIYIIFFHPI